MRLNMTLVHPTKGPGAVYHDVRDSFGELLRSALTGEPALVGLGPIYAEDPACALLLPFMRSIRESGWRDLGEEMMVPDHVLSTARDVRTAAAFAPFRNTDGTIPPAADRIVDIDDWTRAGLVLEIARRQGFRVVGLGNIHVNWRLRGTITGRFGCEPARVAGMTINPLSLGPEERARIVPSDAVREVAVIDFSAIDVCSMSSLIPELAEILGDHPDPYSRIADLMRDRDGMDRDKVKLNFLTWAYGGAVPPKVRDELNRSLEPVVRAKRLLEHGDLPRAVQTTSAIAFRAGLSRALPLLTEMHFRPMFTVHDELTLDCSPVGLDRIKEVTKALEEGASQRIGRPYRVKVRTGYTYQDAKEAR